MVDDQIPFDTFVRPYSACDQILREHGVKERVYWDGGCTIVGDDTGKMRLDHGVQMDMPSFRHRVVMDIRGKYEKLHTGFTLGDRHETLDRPRFVCRGSAGVRRRVGIGLLLATHLME